MTVISWAFHLTGFYSLCDPLIPLQDSCYLQLQFLYITTPCFWLLSQEVKFTMVTLPCVTTWSPVCMPSTVRMFTGVEVGNGPKDTVGSWAANTPASSPSKTFLLKQRHGSGFQQEPNHGDPDCLLLLTSERKIGQRLLHLGCLEMMSHHELSSPGSEPRLQFPVPLLFSSAKQPWAR